MLSVKTPEEVLALIKNEFSPMAEMETVSLSSAIGRTLATISQTLRTNALSLRIFRM